MSLRHIPTLRAPKSWQESGGDAGFQLAVQFPRQLLRSFPQQEPFLPAGRGENPSVSTTKNYRAPRHQSRGDAKIPPQLVPRELP